jgi:RES domain-containing protein
MQVYRITRVDYCRDLSGEGAKRYGGRWNRKGSLLLYTSAHISLAFVELLVNVDPVQLQADYRIMVIHIDDELSIHKLDEKQLPVRWRDRDSSALQDIGMQWLTDGQEAVLSVPSAVIPHESNYLINPAHPEFSKISLLEVLPLEIDVRFQGGIV